MQQNDGATRKCWKERKEEILEIQLPPSWRLTSPIKAEPSRSVVSLAPTSVTTPAMRRHASAWAVRLSLENVLLVVQGFNFPEDSIDVVIHGRDSVDTGGVEEHGTFATGGPVTWETLISPREVSRTRRPGDCSPTSPRYGCTWRSVKKSIRRRGRPSARDDRSRDRRR